MNDLKQLSEMKHNSVAKKYHCFPEHYSPKPKYTDKTANGLTICIIDYIRLSGNQAERINCTGRKVKINGKERWIPTAGQKGTADISATKLIELDGRRIGVKVAIEVKVGRDRQSDAQRLYQHQIEHAGGVYLIATSFEQFLDAWNQI